MPARPPRPALKEIDCVKHGRVRSFPVIRGAIRPQEEWTQAELDASTGDVCIKCLAEAMAPPVRRRADWPRAA